MSSKLELLKQHITELEAENIEIAELRKENAKLRKENTDLRMEFTNFEAERAELKRKIAKTLRMTEEERTRRIAKNAKLKTKIKELEKNNTSFNSGAEHYEEPLEDKGIDDFKDRLANANEPLQVQKDIVNSATEELEK